MSDSKKVEELLEKWYSAKQEMAKLEKKCEKYKKLANDLMKGSNQLKAGDYSVIKRRQTRTMISKKDVPSDLWDKYAKLTSYDAFYVSKK